MSRIQRQGVVVAQPQSNRTGFTLVELLVVVGIIAVLISMLLPTLNKARAAAKTVTCAANLKQLGTLWMLYANDNNGWNVVSWQSTGGMTGLGHGTNWPVIISPYLSSTGTDTRVLQCPEAPRPDAPPAAGFGWGTAGSSYFANSTITPVQDNWNDIYNGGYGMNNWLENLAAFDPLPWNRPRYMPKVANCRQSSDTPMLADAAWIDCGWPDTYDQLTLSTNNPMSAAVTGYMVRFCVNRHRGGINMAMLDGSARWVAFKDLWMLNWYAGYQPNANPVVVP